MAKEFYVDRNGNEIQVSGTVNTADMLPMSGNDSTKVSEAIGDLSQLTTSVTSSLVGAVNAVNAELSNKADKALTAFNLTAGTGMTLQYVNCFAFGNLKVISANIVVGSGATTTIATVPSAYSASNSTFFYLGKNGASGSYGYMTGTSLKTDSVLSTGNYTINFVYR